MSRELMDVSSIHTIYIDLDVVSDEDKQWVLDSVAASDRDIEIVYVKTISDPSYRKSQYNYIT